MLFFQGTKYILCASASSQLYKIYYSLKLKGHMLGWASFTTITPPHSTPKTWLFLKTLHLQPLFQTS